MSGPTKKTNTSRYQFVLTKEQMDMLRLMAEAQCTSMSAVLRLILNKYAKGKLKLS